jgi:hypothetical protein
MDERGIITDALRCFGVGHQAIVAIEELSELQKELTKLLRRQGNKEHIAEEIADVEIMLAQMKEAFGLQRAVSRHKYFKLLRLENRITQKRAARTKKEGAPNA